MTGLQCYFRPPKRLNLNHMTLGIFFLLFLPKWHRPYLFCLLATAQEKLLLQAERKIFSLASLGWIIYHRGWFAISPGRQHPMIKLWINDYYNNDNNNNNYKNNNCHFYYCSIILVVFYLLINICYCVGFRAPRSSKDQFKQTCIKSYCAIHSVD